MITLDWIIVGVAALLALNGMRQGFVVGVLQLAGFAAGAFAGGRLAPLVLSGGAESPYTPLVALGAALALGTLFAAGLEVAGLALRRMMVLPGLRATDAGLGGLLGVALALGLAWMAATVALQTPGLGWRRDVQRSEILSRLTEELPASGFLLNALARFDPLPDLPGPSAGDVAPPAPEIARSPGVLRAGDGVVRILGEACGLQVEGSGWIAADGVVVTNAHVVAGEDDTIVQVRGGAAALDARVVHFDVTNDVAVLRVPGLPTGRGLALAGTPTAGTAAAVLGYPGNGPFTVRAARLGDTRRVLARDAYGRGPVSRTVTAFRGRVEPGNSGGPVVDADGRVLATVFARRVSDGPSTGYGVPDAIVRDALARAGSTPVGTGACAT